MLNSRVIKNRYISWAIRLSLIFLPVIAIFVVPRYNKRALQKKMRIVETAYKELSGQGKLIVPERKDVDVLFFPTASAVGPVRIIFSSNSPHLLKTVYRVSVHENNLHFENCETKEVQVYPIAINLSDNKGALPSGRP